MGQTLNEFYKQVIELNANVCMYVCMYVCMSIGFLSFKTKRLCQHM
jgi:hypothetical protein